MYAMNIQNDVIGLVLRENCKHPILSGSPDHGPDKDSIENKMPFILYIVT
jgi:hypothetical protein